MSSARLPFVVTVKPRPIGATVIKGATFQGQFRNGSITDPDVLEVGKTNTYNLIEYPEESKKMDIDQTTLKNSSLVPFVVHKFVQWNLYI